MMRTFGIEGPERGEKPEEREHVKDSGKAVN